MAAATKLYIRRLFKYLLLAAVILFISSLITALGAYQHLKNAATSGLAAKDALSAAASDIKRADLESALANSRQAKENFTIGLKAIKEAKQNWAFRHIPIFRQQLDDLGYLLESGEVISRSLNTALPISRDVAALINPAQGQSFNQLNRGQKIALLQKLNQAAPELAGLKANLDLVMMTLDKIHRIGILWPVYSRISDLKEELRQANEILQNLLPLAKLLPAIGGYPTPANYLVLLQNNDELRPSGGFIGVYGIISVDSGELVRLETDDSYHIDMPAVGRWRMEPPAQIKKYLKVENWYLRDANWSPDWPTAAQKTLEIYQGESAAIATTTPHFDGVIAITPDLIANLISLVGPITIRGETYRPENFQELLQYNVEVAYKDRDISSWDRKDIVNELLEELEKKLFSLPSEKWPLLLKIINNDIAAKNIQLYFTRPEWQSLAENIGATGRVKQTDGDFLMVVDANLAAFKSDAVVKKTISYEVREEKDSLKASLRLSYQHDGSFDWRTTRYRSYTRVYAPLGSRFLSLGGLPLDKADFSTTDDPALNKTVFGFFLSVEPGHRAEISLDYTLPQKIYQSFRSGQYQLLAQKQAGRRTEKIDFSLAPFGQKGSFVSSDLKTDRVFNWQR